MIAKEEPRGATDAGAAPDSRCPHSIALGFLPQSERELLRRELAAGLEFAKQYVAALHSAHVRRHELARALAEAEDWEGRP